MRNHASANGCLFWSLECSATPAFCEGLRSIIALCARFVLLHGPLLVLLEEQAVRLAPFLRRSLGEGGGVLGSSDLARNHLHLRRIEPIEGNIVRDVVLDLRRRVHRS